MLKQNAVQLLQRLDWNNRHSSKRRRSSFSMARLGTWYSFYLSLVFAVNLLNSFITLSNITMIFDVRPRSNVFQIKAVVSRLVKVSADVSLATKDQITSSIEAYFLLRWCCHFRDAQAVLVWRAPHRLVRARSALSYHGLIIRSLRNQNQALTAIHLLCNSIGCYKVLTSCKLSSSSC